MAQAKTEAFKEPSVSLAKFAKALSHPARIEILRLLSGRGEMPCADIVTALPLSQPSCSRHINALLKTGLLKSRQIDGYLYYKAEAAALRKFCNAMGKTLHP